MSIESQKWYRMSRPLFNSGFEDDEFWAYGKDGFQEVLDSFIGSDVLIYPKTLQAQPQKVRAIIQNTTSDVYNSTTQRQILCNIGILRCGQYVSFDGSHWLVSALPDNNRIYEKAVLWKCKSTLRFISPLTGEVVEYPVYTTNSTQYGTGEAEKEHISVGEAQHLMYVPYNEETILIDDRFRFLLDKNRVNPTAYRVTQVDPLSYAVGGEKVEDGLIQWSVIETQFNSETDNAELMIADYYDRSPGDNQSVPGDGATLTLTDLDGDMTLAIGETKQVVVGCVDSDGNELSEFTYMLEYDFGDAAYVLRQDGNTLTLQANNDRAHVGKEIVVKAVSETLQSEATMTIQIVNW